MRVTVYFRTRDPAVVGRIRGRFRLAGGVSVNGEIRADIREEDMPLLRETERRGFIEIRIKPERENDF